MEHSSLSSSEVRNACDIQVNGMCGPDDKRMTALSGNVLTEMATKYVIIFMLPYFSKMLVINFIQFMQYHNSYQAFAQGFQHL